MLLALVSNILFDEEVSNRNNDVQDHQNEETCLEVSDFVDKTHQEAHQDFDKQVCWAFGLLVEIVVEAQVNIVGKEHHKEVLPKPDRKEAGMKVPEVSLQLILAL